MGAIVQDTPVHDGIPTLDWLHATVPEELNAHQLAEDWLCRFSEAVETGDTAAVLETIHPDGWWRDFVALTWDIRTFHGADNIRPLLDDRLKQSQLTITPIVVEAMVSQPYPDLLWVVVQFPFTAASGTGTATAFLVPTSLGSWQAYIVCTDLDTVSGTQECFGPGRDATRNRGDAWVDERNREKAFEGQDPDVLIVGAGQSGLALAARLKNMGVPSLIVEKNPRVGDQWRKRYDSLRLHDFVCQYYSFARCRHS